MSAPSVRNCRARPIGAGGAFVPARASASVRFFAAFDHRGASCVISPRGGSLRRRPACHTGVPSTSTTTMRSRDGRPCTVAGVFASSPVSTGSQCTGTHHSRPWSSTTSQDRRTMPRRDRA